MKKRTTVLLISIPLVAILIVAIVYRIFLIESTILSPNAGVASTVDDLEEVGAPTSAYQTSEPIRAKGVPAVRGQAIDEKAGE